MSSTSNVPEPNFKAILAAQMGNVKGIFKARIKQAKRILLNKFKQRLLDTATQKVVERLSPNLCQKIGDIEQGQNQISDVINSLNQSLDRVSNLAQTILGPITTLLKVVSLVLSLPIPQAVPPGIGVPISITTKLQDIKDKVLDIVLHARNLSGALLAVVNLVRSISGVLTAISAKIDAVVGLAQTYCSILGAVEDGDIPEDILDDYEQALFDLIAALGLEIDGLDDGQAFDDALTELLELIEEYEAEEFIPEGIKSRLRRRLIESGYQSGNPDIVDALFGGTGDTATDGQASGLGQDGLPLGSDGDGSGDIPSNLNSEIFEGIDGNLYLLEVVEDPTSPEIAPRRFGVAKTKDEGVVVLKSPPTFALDARVILNDIKVRLNRQLTIL